MSRIRKLCLFSAICALLLLCALPVQAERLANTVYVAGNASAYPLEYYDHGAFQGAFPQLLEQIGTETGLEFVYLPPEDGITQHQRAVNRQAELVSCLVRTEEWEDAVHVTITDPLYCIALADGTTVEVCLGLTDLLSGEQAQLILDALSRYSTEPPVLTSEEMVRPTSFAWWLLLPAAVPVVGLLLLRQKRRKAKRQPQVLDERLLCEHLDGLDPVARLLWYLAVMQLEEPMDAEALRIWRRPGCIPAALGEREAALLFTRTTDEQAVVAAETVAYSLHAEHTALLPLRENEMASAALLSSARQGCRLAQKQGIAQMVCSGPVWEALSQREMLMRQLHTALEKGQFELYIQPIVRASDGKPMGGEALSRWDHPKLGFLTPGRFLSLVQELGVETELDQYQLRRVCQELVRWREAGREDLNLHCNVSRKTLSDDAFPQWLGELLEQTGLPAQALTIEVTEEMEGPEGRKAMLKNLRLLKRSGVRLALDDYGTGATCAEDLTLGLYDVVKLDVSLLRAAHSPEGLRAMEEILCQIHDGGAQAVCEGVETAEEAALVYRLGCEQIQGFYYHRPLPQRFARKLILGDTK